MKNVHGLILGFAAILSTSAIAETSSTRMQHLMTCTGMNDDRYLKVDVYSDVDGSSPDHQSGEGIIVVDEDMYDGNRHFAIPSVQMEVASLDCGGAGLGVIGRTESHQGDAITIRGDLCEGLRKGVLVLDGERLPITCIPDPM